MSFKQGQQVKVNEGHIREGQVGTIRKIVLVTSIKGAELDYFVEFADGTSIIYGWRGITQS